MELMSQPISFHIFTIFLLVGLIVLNYFKLSTYKDINKLKIYYSKMTPFFHFVNASIAYTGALVSAYLHNIGLVVLLMIFASLFIMISEIKRYKRLRVIRSNEFELQNSFIKYAKNITYMQAVLIVVVSIISFL
ncbi:MAG: hypothetical protein B1H07_02485 [Campylobacteraceae bacterium 4484_166]|nr:MAG: hypothetical protein B1H07_02485 [Campylobacteraceae bacterium 4484_166]